MGLFSFLTSDIAIDLGTANTLIIHNDKIVVDEPSIIAVDRTSNKVLAVGRSAMQMHEKTHDNIKTIRPLKDGVIADFYAAEQMIRVLIKMIDTGNRLFQPSHRMVICIPSGITEVEKRAVRDSAEHAGAKEVWMIQEPMAAAIGIGIDVEQPIGSMIVDIGGGTTEIAAAIDKSVSKIEEAVLKALEISPPELSADIYINGIHLTGGGALLRGLDKRLAAKTKLPIHIAEDPLRAVVRGTGAAIKNIEGFKNVLLS